MIIKIAFVDPEGKQQFEEELKTFTNIPRKGEYFFIQTQDGKMSTFLVKEVFNYYKNFNNGIKEDYVCVIVEFIEYMRDFTTPSHLKLIDSFRNDYGDKIKSIKPIGW